MPGIKNPNARLIGQVQASLLGIPAAAATVLPFTSFDVARDPQRQQNNTVNQSALREKTDKGDPSVGGPIASILDLRTIGFWLRLAFGAATVGKAVTKQPTNVTGVTIHYASNDTTSGNGTIAYTAAGTTATWACQGGAAGAPVNIGAGGQFTLQSNGGGKSITISVNAASLPGGNVNDADIAVSNTLKAHVFPITPDLRPNALLEMQHSDVAKYQRILGCSVNTLAWDVLNRDQNIALGIVAAQEVDPIPGAAFDANPTAYAAVRACSGAGIVSDGGAGLGTVVGGSVEVANNLDPMPAGEGTEGAGYIDNGELELKGRIRTVFTGADAYALARAGTSTRLRLQSSALNGADRFSLTLDMWNVELRERMPPREGRSGLFADLDWNVHRSAHSPIVVLVNDIAAH